VAHREFWDHGVEASRVLVGIPQEIGGDHDVVKAQLAELLALDWDLGAVWSPHVTLFAEVVVCHVGQWTRLPARDACRLAGLCVRRDFGGGDVGVQS
jgi:hypothetical protein